MTLCLLEEDGEVVVTMKDDGHGFDEATLDDRVSEGHIGLASHRARLENVGGSLLVESSVGRGTFAEIRVPRA